MYEFYLWFGLILTHFFKMDELLLVAHVVTCSLLAAAPEPVELLLRIWELSTIWHILHPHVLGLVDSGNSFYNAISLALATKICLIYYQPYVGPPVGTALAGSTLDIVGVIKNITFILTDESGMHHLLSSRLVIV